MNTYKIVPAETGSPWDDKIHAIVESLDGLELSASDSEAACLKAERIVKGAILRKGWNSSALLYAHYFVELVK